MSDISNDEPILIDPLQDELFPEICTEAKPFAAGARKKLLWIQSALQTAPELINAVKAIVPEHSLQAVLTDEQKMKIADGAIKFMTRKKDGNIVGILVSTSSGQIDSQVALKDITSVSNLPQAIISFKAQLQMAQIAVQLRDIQSAIADVRQELENDRFAHADSLQQRFQQAMRLNDPENRRSALLLIAHDAEDCRNEFFRSQQSNLDKLSNEPESFWGKVFSRSNNATISKIIYDIRKNLNVVIIVSLLEAAAYQELGELESAQQSLRSFENYLQSTFFGQDRLIDRLDSMDPSSTNQYWKKTLSAVKKMIQELPCIDSNQSLLEEENRNG